VYYSSPKLLKNPLAAALLAIIPKIPVRFLPAIFIVLMRGRESDKREITMKKQALNELDLVIEGMTKLSHENGERKNVLAFIQSCYCGRVRDYDVTAAIESLTKLTPEEHHALVRYQMRLL
jgi:hypothetical protein